MAISNSQAIDKKIIEMRKQKQGLYRIHKWLSQWSDFSQLDEMVVLAHILRVLDQKNMAVSRREVLNCFNKFYNEDYHLDKKGYLNWLYKEFNVKIGAVTNPKRAYRGIYERNKRDSMAFREESHVCSGVAL